MDFDYIKVYGTHCYISFTPIFNKFSSQSKWLETNHIKLFNFIKNKFGHLFVDTMANKCCVLFMDRAYVLDIKEFEKFLSKYCMEDFSKENIIDWRQDGF